MTAALRAVAGPGLALGLGLGVVMGAVGSEDPAWAWAGEVERR